MANHNPPTELDKYSGLVLELENRASELVRYHQQKVEFLALEATLRAERAEVSGAIYDASGSVDNLATELDRLDRAIKLNSASSEVLSARIGEREGWLHAKVPLAIACFGRLREYALAQSLEACRKTVESLISPDVAVAEEHTLAIAQAMPGYLKVNRIALPSIGWVATRPLDEKPIYWSNLTRPYTAEELTARRAEQVKAILAAGSALILAARGLLEAARGLPVEAIPPFVCEPEVEPAPRQADPRILEWNQPLGGSDEAWLKKICEAAGRTYPPTNPGDIEILKGMLENRHANPVSHGVVTTEMVGDTFLP